MRQWLILTAIGAVAYHSACGQSDGSFSGTTYDLDSGRINVINGTYTAPKPSVRDGIIADYRRMNAELEQSINHQNQMYELGKQTRELREQTELLRNMSKEVSGGFSSSYVPPPIVVAPNSYVPPTSRVPQESREERAARFKAQQEVSQQNDAITSAKGARSFNAGNKQPRERQLSANESPQIGDLNSPTNDKLIEGLLQEYKGNFTDYAWSAERVDNQTFIVRCSVSLDGTPHDFRFRVNNTAGTCRYEGGTALGKLAPLRKIEFVPVEENPSEPLTDSTLEKLGLERVTNEGAKRKFAFTKDRLKQARDAGISDEESWEYLASKDERFAKARAAGRSLDELAEENSQ